MKRPKSQSAALMTSPEDIEAEFYEAMQAADIERLMAVWADDDEVVCVHPGAGTRVIGSAAVRASFEAIFASGGVAVEPTQVHRVHTVASAVHHLVERLQVRTDQGTRTAWVLATNVYVKTAQGWRMVAHHASPGQLGEGPAPEEPASTLH